MEVFTQLADYIHDGSLVAFVGAGVSRTYIDSSSGQSFPGLMSAGEIVCSLSQRRGYINDDMSFLEACYLYKEKEGRVALDRYLQQCIDRPAIKPLPAHLILANIPFSAYITTNFDRLLETALQDAKKSPFPIIDDDDISRMRHSSVPVIKFHGCITRPSTMIACEDEYIPILERNPIVDALLKTQLANKAVLFLGYSLEDQDFKTIFNEVKRTLGDRMPRGFAVVHSATDYQKAIWEKRGVTILECDLTNFLRHLQHTSIKERSVAIYDQEQDWVRHAFFASLHNIRTQPSETQAIDAFLQHLLKEVRSPAFDLADILDRARSASTVVMEQKSNFEAFRKTTDLIVQQIQDQCGSKEEAEEVLQVVLDDRSVQSAGMRRQWNHAIERGDNILTFSQSVRVSEILKGAPRGTQDTCRVYIAECRPKSPVSFQDALAVVDSICDSAYPITLLPDACIGHLISANQIDKILIGAHAIHMYDGKPIWFVNTCGSSQLLDSALRNDIAVYVIAETSKLINMANIDDAPSVSFEEEEDVFEDIMPSVSEFKAGGMNVVTLNIGYDLCRFEDGVHLLTEDGLWGE